MAEVCTAMPARDFVYRARTKLHCAVAQRRPERWPAFTRGVLCGGGVQQLAAARAAVDPRRVLIVVEAAIGRLGGRNVAIETDSIEDVDALCCGKARRSAVRCALALRQIARRSDVHEGEPNHRRVPPEDSQQKNQIFQRSAKTSSETFPYQ